MLLSGVGPLFRHSGKGELVSNRHFHETGIAISIDDVVSLGSQLPACHERRRIHPLVQLRAEVVGEWLDPPAGRAHKNRLLVFHTSRYTADPLPTN